VWSGVVTTRSRWLSPGKSRTQYDVGSQCFTPFSDKVQVAAGQIGGPCAAGTSSNTLSMARRRRPNKSLRICSKNGRRRQDLLRDVSRLELGAG